MRFYPCVALLLPLAVLLGCGAANTASTPTTPPATIPDLSGNWEAEIISSNFATAGPIVDFVGALKFNAGTVTGTFRALTGNGPQCTSVIQDISVTGTLDASGNLVLSVPMPNGTATITAPITIAQGQNHGTWQIVGGACAMPSTPMSIIQYANATGTYTGTAYANYSNTNTPNPATATAITAVLTQSTTANADGEYPLTGSVTTTGACAVSFPIVGGLVQGVSVEATSNPAMTSTTLEGGLSPVADTINAGLLCVTGTFPYITETVYFATLTRQ